MISSAIAFRLFLFFVPLLLFGIGALSRLAQIVDPDPVLDAGRVSGSLRGQIRLAIDQPGHRAWVALGLGLVGIVTAGRTLSRTAVVTSSLAWRLPVRSKATTRVVGALIGLIATMGLVAAVVNRIRADLGGPMSGASFGAAVVVYVVAWTAVLMLLPRAGSDPVTVVPGALLVAVTTALMQMASQLYLPGKISTITPMG